MSRSVMCKLTLMCSMPSYWKQVSSTSARILSGCGVMRRLMFFNSASLICGGRRHVRVSQRLVRGDALQRHVCKQRGSLQGATGLHRSWLRHGGHTQRFCQGAQAET